MGLILQTFVQRMWLWAKLENHKFLVESVRNAGMPSRFYNMCPDLNTSQTRIFLKNSL